MSELDTIWNGLEVSQYTYDTTKPELDSFYMDMDAGTLTLTFSETVDVSKVGRFAQKWVGLRGLSLDAYNSLHFLTCGQNIAQAGCDDDYAAREARQRVESWLRNVHTDRVHHRFRG